MFESHLVSFVHLMRKTVVIPKVKTHAYQRSSHHTERSIHLVVIGLNLSRNECEACDWEPQQMPNSEFGLQGDAITPSALSQVHTFVGNDNRFSGNAFTQSWPLIFNL